MGRRRVLLAAAGLVAAGCAVGPDYRRPELPLPEAWRDIPVTEAETLANTPWWDLFQDPDLQELIRAALAGNQDLKIAVERIEEARALYGFSKADHWPQVDLEGSAARLKPPEEGLIPMPDAEDTPLYSLGASVFWEIDIFGRVRRANEAQWAILMATDAARQAVVLTLVSDVSQAYFEMRDLDRRLAISRSTLQSRREYVELARTRFEGGITSELDFRQAEAEMYRTEAIVDDFERLVAQKENELSVLLGRNPGAVPRGREIHEEPVPPAVPAGLPSDLLDRRPDLREAEQLLVSANARIGEAKALLFPRISLTGGYGWVSTDLGDLFKGPSVAWSIAGNLLQPLFNAGKNRRRVEVTESQERQSLYAYELSVLRAFQEVEDSLVGYRKGGDQRTSQTLRVAAERKVLELAEMRYRGGVADYLDVLDAQRSLFSAELDEVTAIRDQLVSLVQLYKALGGGWPAAPDTDPSGAPPVAPSGK